MEYREKGQYAVEFAVSERQVFRIAKQQTDAITYASLVDFAFGYGELAGGEIDSRHHPRLRDLGGGTEGDDPRPGSHIQNSIFERQAGQPNHGVGDGRGGQAGKISERLGNLVVISGPSRSVFSRHRRSPLGRSAGNVENCLEDTRFATTLPGKVGIRRWEGRLLIATTGAFPIDERLLTILRCPVCKGALRADPSALLCPVCLKTYPIILGIPDLRVYADPLIGLEEDFKKGEKIHAQAQSLSFAELVRYYWSLPTYPPTPEHLRDRFVSHVLTDEERARGYLHLLGAGRALLEVGCGTAALTHAASAKFDFAVGCDVAFRWLLVARKRLEEAGLPANLFCCCADYLPFAPQSFDAVASVALLERLDDAKAAIGEFARVAKPGGQIFSWTANRFSLAPEPHVRVWGVGFLPRRWMAPYVKWVRGMAYDKIRLLSRWEIQRYCRGAGLEEVRFFLPTITRVDWEHLGGVERVAARLFQAGSAIPPLAWLLRQVSPVLLFTARQKRPLVDARPDRAT